jgi:hypothetical protein
VTEVLAVEAVSEPRVESLSASAVDDDVCVCG